MVSKFLGNIKNSQDKISLLNKKLINILREYFNLRIQLKMGQLKQLHLLKKSRRDIVSLKSYLSKNKNIDKN